MSVIMPNAEEETLALSGTQRYLGRPLCANKLQKMVLWFAQANLPDSLLRLHILGMVLFVCDQELASYQEELKIYPTTVVPSRLCHGSTVIRVPLKGHCRRSAVAVKAAKGGLLCEYTIIACMNHSIIRTFSKSQPTGAAA